MCSSHINSKPSQLTFCDIHNSIRGPNYNQVIEKSVSVTCSALTYNVDFSEFSISTGAMRPTLVRLIRQRRPERKAEPLLPPLSLYRAILRAHVHKLPQELRYLGDEYVKAEFKAHKTTDNPLYIVGFLTQWQDYLRSLDGGSWQEGKLTQSELDKMSPEQIGQLYELMKETKKLGMDEE